MDFSERGGMLTLERKILRFATFPSRNDRRVSDGRDKVAVAPCLDTEDREAGFKIVEGHAFDQTRDDFSWVIAN